MKAAAESKSVTEPISHGISAEVHSPVYRMHRYFARRPGNVFSYLIDHYSLPGQVVLDPFCGGGVTVVEGLHLHRRVVGVDLNPMATFITETEIMWVDPSRIEKEFTQIQSDIGSRLDALYAAQCPNCENAARGIWFEWAALFRCPKCGSSVDATQKKLGRKYLCRSCGTTFPTARLPKSGERLLRLSLRCPSCGFNGERPAREEDSEHAKRAEGELQGLVQSGEISYPEDALPAGNLEAENSLHAKGLTHFSKLFSPRNLLALALLKRRVDQIKNAELRRFFHMVFSATIDYSTNMSRVVQGSGREITTHTFWPPDTPAENNVWFSFEKRVDAAIAGKTWSQKYVGEVSYRTTWSQNAKSDAVLLTQSSDELPLPDSSVDLVLTDPPYGGNVNYLELSNLWTVWIKDELGLESGLLDRRKEAILDRRSFTGSKRLEDYQRSLHSVLRECWRVMKPDGWLVMTFHNRELAVWNSLLSAAHDAGFALTEKNGVIYQPPIGAYTTTLHQKRSGSVLGDFVLTFRKGPKPAGAKDFDITKAEARIVEQVTEVIRYHAGASVATIYMQLIPFLTNSGLLHRVAQSDLEPLLSKHFAKKGDRWYFKEDIDSQGNVKPFDYVPAEMRVEQLIRSILKEKRQATLDEIYAGLYMNLVNGLTPESSEIGTVLDRIASRVRPAAGKRDVWQLKGQTNLIQWSGPQGGPGPLEDHNEIILALAERAALGGSQVHVGEKEASSDPRLKAVTTPMGDPLSFGLGPDAFRIIRQIDLLWLRGNAIVAAFEVEKSTTIDSGLNRFRNLFVALPNLSVPAFIVVPPQRVEEAWTKINSPANRREGLPGRVSVLSAVDIPDFNLGRETARPSGSLERRHRGSRPSRATQSKAREGSSQRNGKVRRLESAEGTNPP